jgi:hypothetical protein
MLLAPSPLIRLIRARFMPGAGKEISISISVRASMARPMAAQVGASWRQANLSVAVFSISWWIPRTPAFFAPRPSIPQERAAASIDRRTAGRPGHLSEPGSAGASASIRTVERLNCSRPLPMGSLSPATPATRFSPLPFRRSHQGLGRAFLWHVAPARRTSLISSVRSRRLLTYGGAPRANGCGSRRCQALTLRLPGPLRRSTIGMSQRLPTMRRKSTSALSISTGER